MVDAVRQHPRVGAGVVVEAYRGGGDVRNAWGVLVQAVGRVEAARLVRVVAEERNVPPHAIFMQLYTEA